MSVFTGWFDIESDETFNNIRIAFYDEKFLKISDSIPEEFAIEEILAGKKRIEARFVTHISYEEFGNCTIEITLLSGNQEKDVIRISTYQIAVPPLS